MGKEVKAKAKKRRCAHHRLEQQNFRQETMYQKRNRTIVSINGNSGFEQVQISFRTPLHHLGFTPRGGI